ncbi:MAG: hypothetical protein LT070_09365 [Solirubrobacteraceae bacterium]|nr:hypothetical protein [Solirubrobacteraceae bacterium]
MARNVKRSRSEALPTHRHGSAESTGVSPETTRISSKHQITIGRHAFGRAGLRVGDVVRVHAIAPGKVVLDRTDDLIARYSGALSSGGSLRAQVEALREEWD